jgi:hypothetical protein
MADLREKAMIFHYLSSPFVMIGAPGLRIFCDDCAPLLFAFLPPGVRPIVTPCDKKRGQEYGKIEAGRAGLCCRLLVNNRIDCACSG